MDDKKDVINNSENQANDNMDYSFDFANQVDANTAPVTPEVTPATPENTVTLETPATDNVAATPVAENAVPEASTTEIVTPEAATNTQETISNVEVTSAPEVTPTPENSVTPETAPEQTTTDAANADGIPVMSGVAPVTPETVGTAENNSEEESLELIKDKKATKRFLIILFVLLLVFIIALPFIFNVAG